MKHKKLAEQAGWSGVYSVWLNPNEVIFLPVPVTEQEFERFAELVRADEREACALLAEGNGQLHEKAPDAVWAKVVGRLIRARGNK